MNPTIELLQTIILLLTLALSPGVTPEFRLQAITLAQQAVQQIPAPTTNVFQVASAAPVEATTTVATTTPTLAEVVAATPISPIITFYLDGIADYALSTPPPVLRWEVVENEHDYSCQIIYNEGDRYGVSRTGSRPAVFGKNELMCMSRITNEKYLSTLNVTPKE